MAKNMETTIMGSRVQVAQFPNSSPSTFIPTGLKVQTPNKIPGIKP